MTDLRTAEPRLRLLIDAAAAFVGLPTLRYHGQEFMPGEWLEGLILAESGGDPRAWRYEPHQDRASRRDAPSDADTADRDDGEMEDDRSFGLTQILGSNVRRLCGVPAGTPMRFGWLFLPMTNLSFGLRVLLGEVRAVYAAHPHETESEHVVRALARYNGGPTWDAIVDGDFRLRAYVDRVAEHAAIAQADRREHRWETV